ncbi:Uncharacterized protein FKW44_021667 [Caligus rogercresseyi]|uniref:Uncharacterized protein n=1 Tax=Caligus rogercresseyi TaxID=217165 RepID=A0A7T8JW06_CALRO|nr:Uncharacterized protein FKW44_021667 [Caligus rogercresseyi]
MSALHGEDLSLDSLDSLLLSDPPLPWSHHLSPVGLDDPTLERGPLPTLGDPSSSSNPSSPLFLNTFAPEPKPLFQIEQEILGMESIFQPFAEEEAVKKEEAASRHMECHDYTNKSFYFDQGGAFRVLTSQTEEEEEEAHLRDSSSLLLLDEITNSSPTMSPPPSSSSSSPSSSSVESRNKPSRKRSKQQSSNKTPRKHRVPKMSHEDKDYLAHGTGIPR